MEAHDLYIKEIEYVNVLSLIEIARTHHGLMIYFNIY